MPAPEPSQAAHAPRDILVIKPSSLGDVVHTLPSVALLRRAFPEARIRWLINTEWMPLLAGNPHIDEAIEFPRRHFRGIRGALRIAPWARELRQRVAADLILDYQGLLRSALIGKLCRDDMARVIGLSDAREGARYLYDHEVDVAGIVHAVDRYLALTQYAMGLGGRPAPTPPLGPHPAQTGVRDPATGLDANAWPAPLSWPLPWGEAPGGFKIEDRFIVLHPFSRGAGKSLTVDQVREFCQALPGEKIVIVGRADTPLPTMEGTVDLLNKTSLTELVWLLRFAKFVVSVDSGPMHIAAAVTQRLVSIHTWSDPAKVGPYQPEAWVWKDGALFQMKDLADPTKRQPAAGMTDIAQHVASCVVK